MSSQFDMDALREAVADDTDLLQKIVDHFKKSSQTNLAELKLAIEHRDRAALAASAHYLKGSLLGLFAKDAVQQLLRLERFGQGAHWEELSQEWRELDRSIANLVLELEAVSLPRSA